MHPAGAGEEQTRSIYGHARQRAGLVGIHRTQEALRITLFGKGQLPLTLPVIGAQLQYAAGLPAVLALRQDLMQQAQAEGIAGLNVARLGRLMSREPAVEYALSIAGAFGCGPVMPFYQGHLPAASCQGQGGSAAGNSSAYDQRAALAGRRPGAGQPGSATSSGACDSAGQGAAEHFPLAPVTLDLAHLEADRLH